MHYILDIEASDRHTVQVSHDYSNWQLKYFGQLTVAWKLPVD